MWRYRGTLYIYAVLSMGKREMEREKEKGGRTGSREKVMGRKRPLLACPSFTPLASSLWWRVVGFLAVYAREFAMILLSSLKNFSDIRNRGRRWCNVTLRCSTKLPHDWSINININGKIWIFIEIYKYTRKNRKIR